MNPFRYVVFIILVLAGMLNLHAIEREIWGTYKLGIVGAEKGSLVYAAVKAGAQDAAMVLEQEHKLKIDLLFAAPSEPTAQGQDGILGEFFIQGVNGYAIDPNPGQELLDETNFLLTQGIPAVYYHRELPGAVGVCFQSDPRELGTLATDTLAKLLEPKGGRVAVLAGDPRSDFNSELLEGAKIVARSPDRKIQPYGIFPCKETLTDSLEEIQQVMAKDKDGALSGWLFLGPWPLSGEAHLPWEPETMPCVVIGAHPVEFPFLQRGEVDALIAEDYYEWGYRSVVYLIHKLHLKSEPADISLYTGGKLITKQNLKDYRAKWVEWLK